MIDHGLYRRALSALAAAAILFVVPWPAVADTPISTQGTVGAHHLNDTMGRPGVRCMYEDGAGGGEEVLYLLKVKAPIIFAVDASFARDKQLVGWQAVIQRRDSASGPFLTVKQGGLHTAWAWDDTAALLYGREYGVNSRYGSDFRVRIKMFWYARDGSTSGRAVSAVDWYRKMYLSDDFGDDIETLYGYCPDFDLQ